MAMLNLFVLLCVQTFTIGVLLEKYKADTQRRRDSDRISMIFCNFLN